MALPKQLIYCVFDMERTGQTEYAWEITLQDTDIVLISEFYGGSAYDEALSGKRLPNIRGYRFNLNINFSASREAALNRLSATPGAGSASDMRSLYNDIVEHFVTHQQQSIRVFLGSNLSTLGDLSSKTEDVHYFEMVPTSMEYSQTYSNQIGRFTPSMSFTSQKIFTSIPSALQGVL